MKTINFYFPLRADIISRDEEGFDYDNPYEVYGGTLSEYKEAIEEKFEDYLDGDDMAKYFDSDDNAEVAAKLQSMDWSFVDINYELFGKVAVTLSGDISDEAIQDLKDYITGQNSDGLGEGFEQQDITIDDESFMNLHMWTSDSSAYFVDTEEEFLQRMSLDSIDESSDGVIQSM